MRKINLFFLSLAALIFIWSSCEKESDTNPELYGEYLSVEVKSINDNIEEVNYQIQILNSRDKIFEKDCNLIFTLRDKSYGKAYTAEENVVNKKSPDDPVGYLNLQGGGQFTIVSNINQLDWKGYSFNDIETGNYNLQVTLFIDDPLSPNHLIRSNILSFKKN